MQMVLRQGWYQVLFSFLYMRSQSREQHDRSRVTCVLRFCESHDQANLHRHKFSRLFKCSKFVYMAKKGRRHWLVLNYFMRAQASIFHDEFLSIIIQPHILWQRLTSGRFQSFPPLYCHKIRPNPLLSDFEPILSPDGRFILQNGIARTNCVDCLDRTNVAQFGIGLSV